MEYCDVIPGKTFRDVRDGAIFVKTLSGWSSQIGGIGITRSFPDHQDVDLIVLKFGDGTPDPKTAAELERMIGEFRRARKDFFALSIVRTREPMEESLTKFSAETEWIIAGRPAKVLTFGDLKLGEPFQCKPKLKNHPTIMIKTSTGSGNSRGAAMSLGVESNLSAEWYVDLTDPVTRLTWQAVADIIEGTKDKTT